MTNTPTLPNAAIFDMDGLLLDTEPLWGSSMLKIANAYQIPVKPEFIKVTTGLRIYEVTALWESKFPWEDKASSEQVAEAILDDIIAAAKKSPRIMPGVEHSLQLLQTMGIRIGLATSSPMRMVKELIPAFGLAKYFDVLTSADTAKVGKPHPEVFLQCADSLGCLPRQCVVFEDSINGMIAAKAAGMKAVIVPEAEQYDNPKFALADGKLKSLQDFDKTLWHKLTD